MNQEKDLLVAKNIEFKKKSGQKLRIGELGRQLAHFRAGIFPSTIPVYGLEHGSFFDGENVYWRKPSQALWDENLHGPLFRILVNYVFIDAFYLFIYFLPCYNPVALHKTPTVSTPV